MAPEDVKLPTDGFVEPNDLEFYLLGRMEGRKPGAEKSETSAAATASAEAKGFGHEL